MNTTELVNVGERARDEQFTKIGRVHDWRNYVPNEFRDIWRGLPPAVRGAIVMMAERAADKEEWD